MTVGTVNSANEGAVVFGIFTTSHDVTLFNQSGTLSLNQGTNAGTATLRLTSGGGVTQGALGKITASNFGLIANGDADLSVASPVNHVTGTLAASDSASGALINFKGDSAFNIGTVSAASTFAGASGVTTNNGDITVNAGGDVTLNVVNAGMANVSLSSSGVNGFRSAAPNDGTADVTGNIAIGNGVGAAGDGIVIDSVGGGSNTITGNLISGNLGNGINLGRSESSNLRKCR